MNKKTKKAVYVRRNPPGADGVPMGGPKSKRHGTVKSHGTNMGKSLLRKLDQLGIK